MMTDTLVGVSPLRKAKKTLTPEEVERAAVRELVKAARARGEDLTGPDGLLKAITKQVIEAALEEEMTEHVGYDKHAVEGRNGENSRNGTRAKTVLTDNAGPVQVEVPWPASTTASASASHQTSPCTWTPATTRPRPATCSTSSAATA